ncbi:BAX inhibitor (BI)-1/YccA family protein, partial [bacterium]|nr:BAX inhibitor (BI)-1/YccA family protein [bacterium]
MNDIYQSSHNPAAAQQSALATNKVLRNTYMLRYRTLLFSATLADVSMVVG